MALLDLPVELLYEILLPLNPLDMINVRMTCQVLKVLVEQFCRALIFMSETEYGQIRSQAWRSYKRKFIAMWS